MKIGPSGISKFSGCQTIEKNTHSNTCCRDTRKKIYRLNDQKCLLVQEKIAFDLPQKAISHIPDSSGIYQDESGGHFASRN